MQPPDPELVASVIISAYLAEQVDMIAQETSDDEKRKELRRAAEIIRSTCNVPR